MLFLFKKTKNYNGNRSLFIGFLSTGDDVIPGNWALKDCVLALQWYVKQTMDIFGVIL